MGCYDSAMNATVRGWLIAIGLVSGGAGLALQFRDDAAPKPRGVLELLEEVARVFADVKGRLPATVDDFRLVDPRVDEPFLERIPTDAWGRACWIQILDPVDGRFRVGSDGADGVRGTADDQVRDSRWTAKPK